VVNVDHFRVIDTPMRIKMATIMHVNSHFT
jgi:hypothetical protein